jgi:hypothetical protein
VDSVVAAAVDAAKAAVVVVLAVSAATIATKQIEVRDRKQGSVLRDAALLFLALNWPFLPSLDSLSYRGRMIRTCAACLILLSFASQVTAQTAKAPDPAKAALIEELIVALKAEQQQQQVMQTMQTATQNQVKQILDSQLKTLGDGSEADAEKERQVRADLEDFQRRMFALMNAHMSWRTMKPVIVEMYDETFTTEELQPLVEFMKSPAGQAYIVKMPTMIGNMMKRMQQVVAEMMPDIQKLNAEFMQQMKEKYPDKH